MIYSDKEGLQLNQVREKNLTLPLYHPISHTTPSPTCRKTCMAGQGAVPYHVFPVMKTVSPHGPVVAIRLQVEALPFLCGLETSVKSVLIKWFGTDHQSLLHEEAMRKTDRDWCRYEATGRFGARKAPVF